MSLATVDGGAVGAERVGVSYRVPLALMVSLYFGIGFISTMNDVLIPHFKDLFHLTNLAALLVQFCFFGAYFLLSVPSGRVVGAIGYKASIVAALCTMGLGLGLFVPASIAIWYPLFLFALFVVGGGLALLQVAINPYVGALGPTETASTRLNLAGGFNSIAGTLAPKVGAAFIFIAAGASTAELARSVRMPYAVLAGCAFAMAAITYFVRLPDVIERPVDGGAPGVSAWSFRHLRLGALAIFFYVGAEVAIGSIMIAYLGQAAMGGMSHVAAARYVSLYWGGAMVGRFAGFAFLRRIRAQRTLAFVAVGAAVCVAFSMVAHGYPAALALVACGLFNSVMWPCIFPLGVEGLGSSTSQGSGILVTMVVGGAIIPEIQGYLADGFGYRASFGVVLVCYLYLVYFGGWGWRRDGEGSVGGGRAGLEA